MLNEATHVDFHLLGLSTTSPPLTQPEQNTSDKNKSDDTTRNILHLEQAIQREEVSPSPTEAEPTNSIIAADHDNSDESENIFCQRLLLLGAKWFDSYKRYRFVNGYGASVHPYIYQVEQGLVEQPTMRERRWLRVGWEGCNNSQPTDT